MTDYWIVFAGVVWTLLIASLIFLALSRTIAAWRDRRLIRAGLSAASPRHLYLRHVIETEDRMGIMLTIGALLCSGILALLLTNAIFDAFIRRLVELFSFS